MEAIVKPRLHPLLTAAAISVTVFSAVGVGALTGLLPTTRGSAPEVPTVAAPAPVTAAVSTPIPEVAPAMPAAPATSPAHKPVKKVVARASTPSTSYSPAPVTNNDFGSDPRIAQAPSPYSPAPAPVEAPRPVVPAGTFGVVESVREVTQPGETTGLGPIAGGIAGAVLGNQVGHGMGKNIATVLGAAGGAFAGKEIEKRSRSTKSWEISVRLDDGSHRSFTSSTAPFWQAGNRVRLVEGKLQPV
jgi:outer membrane lipoprotein SlyB